ncbi:hypothetical protein SAMN05421665_1241 [Yoonia rosea]|uniref:Uncharacterized protein n=1 Tax=Yoonia rosea TaxID=287098 RepID=A0A1R3WSI6_9RHOB|nr:hypothetical protein [Yoonia rosea]SIT81251.1 hypothetical protein SAMN05421665_1241 [Yoonia rosea]
MSLTPEEQAMDIGQILDRIKEIIVNGELPDNLAGDLMSQSLTEFHEKLSKRLDALQEQLKK